MTGHAIVLFVEHGRTRLSDVDKKLKEIPIFFIVALSYRACK